ncbi:hypothetical protein EGR_11245 [Echinococcus granulosus]|uniref:Uncharacterized protein n=1 Tax=Echinococcus granulosus TaxID=6210 RepID=W6TYU6_ECHGR|nr:hypothetical protein EGR_11245 [Echinococcus granulosus]EUB53898.1 hypothetical protein EGR_11245 [Echinococcus granulosus]
MSTLPLIIFKAGSDNLFSQRALAAFCTDAYRTFVLVEKIGKLGSLTLPRVPPCFASYTLLIAVSHPDGAAHLYGQHNYTTFSQGCRAHVPWSNCVLRDHETITSSAERSLHLTSAPTGNFVSYVWHQIIPSPNLLSTHRWITAGWKKEWKGLQLLENGVDCHNDPKWRRNGTAASADAPSAL